MSIEDIDWTYDEDDDEDKTISEFTDSTLTNYLEKYRKPLNQQTFLSSYDEVPLEYTQGLEQFKSLENKNNTVRIPYAHDGFEGTIVFKKNSSLINRSDEPIVSYYYKNRAGHKKTAQQLALANTIFNAPATLAPFLSPFLAKNKGFTNIVLQDGKRSIPYRLGSTKGRNWLEQKKFRRLESQLSKVEDELAGADAFNVTNQGLFKGIVGPINKQLQVQGITNKALLEAQGRFPKGDNPFLTAEQLGLTNIAGFGGKDYSFEYEDASLLKNASRIPRPDLTKPFRTEPHTATLSESEYTQAWFNYPNHSKEGWNKFQEEQGVFITDTKERFKLKPKGRDFGQNLDVSADRPLHVRRMRKEIATYVFGGTSLNLDEAKTLAKNQTGTKEFEPHHRTSFGELAPWLDVIAEKMLNPVGSQLYQEGFALMELMKDVMRKQPYFAGDVKENYSLYKHEGHVGPKGIHPRTGWKIDKDTGEQIGYGLTGASSKPSFNFKSLSKGVGGVPTKEYLKSLPQTREETLTYVKKILEKGKIKKKYIKGGELTMEGNTFINTLVEWLKYSEYVKDAAHEELKEASPETIGPNWAKGE